MPGLEVVEICAGAGGQALGLEKAGFRHRLAVELDANASATLRRNLSSGEVVTGDVADLAVWNPIEHLGVSLLAGGVPCPPFSIAGKQLGANDERDLFAWSVELCDLIKPQALMLENVRGLSMPRFAGYRQHVLDRLSHMGYVAEWRLLQASDFGVPQLRPRFVLVALQNKYSPYFSWPEPVGAPPTVGDTLRDLMASGGWEGADAWARGAQQIAPTIVGGSKKHGGADLGPTRAKKAWAELGVDAMGVADAPPGPGDKFKIGPKLTCEMVARIQGWKAGEWEFEGRKTSRYRQIGNAFPPPVAEAVGRRIHEALRQVGERRDRTVDVEHDPIYLALRKINDFMSHRQLERVLGRSLEVHELERAISDLSRDFVIEINDDANVMAYKLGPFKAFTGQEGHLRNEIFLKHKARIS
ncbi:DNA (cytosine-5-)-methyltransferase [Allokutzneria multivorans]|uniref:Cytosine-specific methyltransferase n=1 Tax=Allokutzneria multivorans TaxID=1142134 RepID=A0ABP7STH5_9PSEU